VSGGGGGGGNGRRSRPARVARVVGARYSEGRGAPGGGGGRRFLGVKPVTGGGDAFVAGVDQSA